MAEKIFNRLFLLVLLAVVKTSSLDLRCPLVWKSYMLGDPFPANTINSAIEIEIGDGVKILQTAVVRGRNGIGQDRIGHMTLKTGAYIAGANKQVLKNPNYLEILVNEHDCDIKWEQKHDKSDQTYFTPTGDTFVGRSNSHHAGGIVSSLGSIDFVNGNNGYENSRSFEVLMSSTPGVHLEYMNLNLDSPITGEFDFVAMDEINNMGFGSTISQTMEHRKSVTEASSFNNTETWESFSSFSIDLKLTAEMEIENMPIDLPLEASFSFSYSKETTESTEKVEYVGSEVQRNLTFARTITVPPNRHVQACTIIGKSDGYASPYSSTGKYTIKGWTGIEIGDYLSEERGFSPSEMTIGSDYVTREEKGVYEGSFFSSSLLVVVDTLDSYDCNTLEHNIHRLQRMKRKGLTQYNNLELLELQNYVRDMLSPQIMLPKV